MMETEFVAYMADVGLLTAMAVFSALAVIAGLLWIARKLGLHDVGQGQMVFRGRAIGRDVD
jgi:hypothetical protein